MEINTLHMIIIIACSVCIALAATVLVTYYLSCEMTSHPVIDGDIEQYHRREEITNEIMLCSMFWYFILSFCAMVLTIGGILYAG